MTQIRILHHGVFACFDAGLTDADGALANVEVSAVAWDGRHLVMASDKDVPGDDRSAVFAVECVDGRPAPDTLHFYNAPLISGARKYEDFALTVAGHHLVATTGFDRIDNASAELDHYNRLLVWPVGQPDAVRLVADRTADGVRSSANLRADLETALGAPYYKVEGLAAIPAADGGDDELAFGIREVGCDHEHFDYVCRVVAAPYRMADDELVFTGPFRVIYEFEPARWTGVRFDVGLSSLEYDPKRGLIYFLTSFEVEDARGEQRIGAYLWRMTLADFHAGLDPELVMAEDGSVFEFTNKAEGVAVLDDNRLFVVYDPDRVKALADEHPRDRREAHEAPYTLLAVD
ncbi:hypothetical protein [Salinisphaera sp. T31B1]|uniref:hypothetical protein n=1 Tax=Salinisphaera sp. T31B1 TaxID=727963 RepID=UPI00333F684D